jgi:hypothetical protein
MTCSRLTKAISRCATRTTVLVFAVFVLLAVLSASALGEDVRLQHARALLERAGGAERVTLEVDATLGQPESFCIQGEHQAATIRGGGPAGVLYGVSEWLARRPGTPSEVASRPDFELRGTVLFLMKEANYDYQLTPEEFPWRGRSLLDDAARREVRQSRGRPSAAHLVRHDRPDTPRPSEPDARAQHELLPHGDRQGTNGRCHPGDSGL